MTRVVRRKSSHIFYAALYMRLSREDGDKEESDSIVNQRRMLEGYLERNQDIVKVSEYVDDGFTGTSFKRPGFQTMITEIEKGNINCVIVKDLSRFGRDYIDAGFYLERYFIDKEVRFIALNDNIDSMVHDYDMLIPVKNVFNAQYAKDISRKVQSSFKVKQKAGEFIGAFASYGYRKDPDDRHRLQVDNYAASIVKRIFKLYIQGNGKIRIANILNEEGVLCPSEYKKLSGYHYKNMNRLESTSYWTYPTIHRMLSNEMYIGNMVQGKTTRRMKGKARNLHQEDWIIVEHTHEPIIDKEQWDKVQNLLKREARHIGLHENISIFSGFLKCGECGRSLAKKYRYSKHLDHTQKRTTYYVCSGYTRYGKKICTSHKIDYEELENILLDDMHTIVNSIKNIQVLVESQKAIRPKTVDTFKTQRGQVAKELIKIRRLKKDIYEDYKEGLLTRDEYLSYKENYQEREEILLKKEEELLTREDATLHQKVLESPWIQRLVRMKSIDKLDRDILAEMVDSIIVYEEKRVKIVYNFSDELDALFKSVIPMESVKSISKEAKKRF